MDTSDKLLKKKCMLGRFLFSVYPKFKVRIEEIIRKHNKEIKWTFSVINDKDSSGGKLITFQLKTERESMIGMDAKLDFFTGLIEDIYGSVGSDIDEETRSRYSSRTIGVCTGDELDESKSTGFKSIKKKHAYYYSNSFGDNLFIVGEINHMIEIGKKHRKLMESVFGEDVQELYERMVEVIEKIFVNKERLEEAKVIVERLESLSNVKKIPYRLKKFRIPLK
jgi:DNA-binding ferritin-like protein (Dps family)